MVEVRIEPVADERSLADWREVHNAIIPTDPLTLDEVRERAGRHRLELARLGDVAVGCSTVRRPDEDSGAMVIARVLPAYRRHGIGGLLYARGLELAREWSDGRPVETVVFASNVSGLAFALRQGFVEVERYLLPGHAVPYVALQLPDD